MCFSRCLVHRILIGLAGLTVTVNAYEPHGSGDHQSDQLAEESAHLVTLSYESRYFSEGRDALDGDALYSTNAEFSWENLTGGFWYGRSAGQSYDELQLALAVTHSVGDFEIYGGYTHFRFPVDGAHDNELGAGVSWTGLPHEIVAAVDVYYSFDAQGYFSELSLARDFTLTEKLSLSASGFFGVNQGYVSDGHDGANHFALQLGLSYEITDTVSVHAHGTYSWAIDRDLSATGDAQLRDFFHAGIGLELTF